jgi:hypothetical protein
MQSQTAPAESFDGIPRSVLLRWMMKAALLGLFIGAWAGIVALRAG